MSNINYHFVSFSPSSVYHLKICQLCHPLFSFSKSKGYDRNLSFIVTQDPLEKTIPDFWRMIYEQKITTLVMLSEIGEGQSKCPIYWPQSGTVTHEDIDITFLEKNDKNEQYNIRKFSIKNSKVCQVQ